MKMIILLLAGVLLSSCMHVGMMGTGDGHHSGASHEMTAEPALEKEVTVGDVRAIGLFPPLRFGEDVVLALRLMDARTSAPILGAHVYLHAQYSHRATHHDHAESPSRMNESDHDINIDQEVTGSPTAGVYSISYCSSQPGEHTLMFHITAIGDRKLDPEIVVEARRTLPSESHGKQHGMMGGTSATTYVVIGAAVMGAMMVAMIVAR
ncbi:MAG: hypothetical protein HY708_05165 [Ignavibacteriae bacterium]|nr:hypothetical protein [Ignavibacteriota bacterium]